MTQQWHCPIPRQLVPTNESESFRNHRPHESGLPLAPHPGAYGVQRQNHVHEGVDLYCPTGTVVHAVEAGRVVQVCPFTGPKANSPWWHDTQAVLVEGPSGVVLYGEISPLVAEGDLVEPGQCLGRVVQVLRNDKGRPMSMLHLELHSAGARGVVEWAHMAEKPPTLQDPTPPLLNAILPRMK